MNDLNYAHKLNGDIQFILKFAKSHNWGFGFGRKFWFWVILSSGENFRSG